MLGGFSQFDKAPLLDISGYANWLSYVLLFAEHAQEDDYQKTMCKNPVLCNLHIKAYFDQQENPSKKIQMVI